MPASEKERTGEPTLTTSAGHNGVVVGGTESYEGSEHMTLTLDREMCGIDEVEEGGEGGHGDDNAVGTASSSTAPSAATAAIDSRGRGKRRGTKRAASESAPAAAATKGTLQFAFGLPASTKAPGRPPPKRGVAAASAPSRQPALSSTADGNVAQTTALWNLQDYGGDSGDELEEEQPKKRAKVSVRKLDSEEQKAYRHNKYVQGPQGSEAGSMGDDLQVAQVQCHTRPPLQ